MAPSSDLGPLLALSASNLQDASHEELVSHIGELQAAVRALQKGPVLSKEQLDAKVEQAQSIAARGISKVISRWVPTAKQGRAKWSYEGVLGSETIYDAMFPRPAGSKSKATKVRKLTVQEFHAALGETVTGSVRYATLHVTGTHVTLNWDADALEYKVCCLFLDHPLTRQLSGTYGIPS